jgi:hypothetical protein
MQWLHRNKELSIKDNPYIMVNAVCSGHMPMVAYLHSEGAPLDFMGEELCLVAVQHDQLEVLQWLATHESPMLEIEHISVLCARFDAMRILQNVFAAFAEHIPEHYPSMLLHTAGVFGHLRVVQWLREQGAAWPEVLQSDTTQHWGGEVSEWMRQQGCTSPVV